MEKKKILFITHESSHTGAPMLLLYLLQWLKDEETNWSIDLLTRKQGSLDNEFKKVADNYDFYFDKYVSAKEYYKQRLFNKNFNVTTYCEDRFYKNYAEREYKVLYANSVVTLPIALEIKKKSAINSKLICNVHELPTIIDIEVSDFENITANVDFFLAGSNLVAKKLHEKYNIALEKIKTVYDFTNFPGLPKIDEIENNHSFTVGAMGTIHWRKGHDLFLLIAINLKKKYPTADIKFRWKGSKPLTEQIILENDLLKSGLSSDYIKFENSSEDYRESFREMDLFLLTSREDPFPLVAVEACMSGLPIITFEEATGINEIILKSGAGGFIVPYLDIDEVTEKIMFYYNNREKGKRDGVANTENFRYFTVESTGPQIIEIINNIIM